MELLAALWLLGAAAAHEPAAEAPAHKEVVLHASIDGSAHQSYRTLPFDVPPGTVRITVAYSYTGRDRGTTIDVGLLGPGAFTAPNGFRGWSGGNKKTFTVSAADATPSYLPGPIDAGRWNILLGIPNIRADERSEVTATVTLEMVRDEERATGADRQTGESAEPVTPEPAVANGGVRAMARGERDAAARDAQGGELAVAIRSAPAMPMRDEPGWYRGDLHMHSGHSDGSCANQSGMRVPCPLFLTLQSAASRGLDFIAVTEHNTTSHLPELLTSQAYFDRLLLIPGMEVTTFQGHANAFGITGPVDFRDGNGFFSALEQQGAIVSINHPNAPSGERCMGCGWTSNADLASVQAIEAVNGADADTPLSGISFWHAQLNKGLRLTGIGGSDNHDATLTESALGRSRIGAPTTVVYAQSLSIRGVQDAIRSGNVFIDVQGTRDRALEMAARAGNVSVPMGGELSVPKKRTVVFTLTVRNVEGAQVEWVRDGEVVSAAATFQFRSDGAPHWIRANVRDAAGHLALVGNPIYLRATP